MEDGWYLFPGQTLQNTKIDDRGRALHVTSKVWKEITGRPERALAHYNEMMKEAAKKKNIKDKSYAMTAEWPDSIPNILQRQEQEREMKSKLIEQKKVERYWELKKEQTERLGEMAAKQRRRIFLQRSDQKLLTSAFILSAVTEDRKKQMEHKAFLKQHADAEEIEEVKKIKQGALDEAREKEEYFLKECRKRQEYGIFLREEMAKAKQKQKDERDTRIKQELFDQVKQKEEMEIIKEMQRKDHEEFVKTVKKQLKEFFDRKNQLITEQKLEEIDYDKATKVYVKAKNEIECMMREKMKGAQLEKAVCQEKIGLRNLAVRLKAEKAEDDRLERSEQEYFAKLEERDRKDLQHIVDQCRARIRDHNAYMEYKLKDKEKEILRSRLELLERFQAKPIEDEYDKQKRIAACLKKKEVGATLKKQMEENRKRAELKAKMEEVANIVTYDEIDKQFLDYGNELIEAAKQNGFSTIPIERAIANYKIRNQLEKPKPKRCEHYR